MISPILAPISSTECSISTIVFRSASPRGEPWLRVAIATTRFLACGAFPLGRGENKITGIILTLMNVQICLHRYTLSRSFHPFPPLCDLLLMTHNTQILVVFRVHFTFVYLRFCPESSPVVHLRRACSASLPAALLWLPAKRRQQTRPCQEDTQKQAQHAAVD